MHSISVGAVTVRDANRIETTKTSMEVEKRAVRVGTIDRHSHVYTDCYHKTTKLTCACSQLAGESTCAYDRRTSFQL